MKTETITDIKIEYAVSLGDRVFYVIVKRYTADGSYNASQTWVSVEEFILPPFGAGWNRLLFPSCHVPEERNDLEAIREAFHAVRNRLKRDVRSWNDYVRLAAQEKGGKRAYYTKNANFWRNQIAASALAWKLAKAIWKQLTKL